MEADVVNTEYSVLMSEAGYIALYLKDKTFSPSGSKIQVFRLNDFELLYEFGSGTYGGSHCGFSGGPLPITLGDQYLEIVCSGGGARPVVTVDLTTNESRTLLVGTPDIYKPTIAVSRDVAIVNYFYYEEGLIMFFNTSTGAPLVNMTDSDNTEVMAVNHAYFVIGREWMNRTGRVDVYEMPSLNYVRTLYGEPSLDWFFGSIALSLSLDLTSIAVTSTRVPFMYLGGHVSFIDINSGAVLDTETDNSNSLTRFGSTIAYLASPNQSAIGSPKNFPFGLVYLFNRYTLQGDDRTADFGVSVGVAGDVLGIAQPGTTSGEAFFFYNFSCLRETLDGRSHPDVEEVDAASQLGASLFLVW